MRQYATVAAATAAALLALAGPAAARDVAACSPAVGDRPSVPGVRIEEATPSAGDLPALIVTVEATGAHLRVFYDGAGEAAARRSAACLGQQLALLASELEDDRQAAEWFSVTFTSEPNYVPPRGPGAKARFLVAVEPDGALPASSRRTILIVLPHEQVHDYQQRAGARLPRWFGEGHAIWIGARVTEAIDPAAARAERESLAAALRAATAPLQLAA